MESRKIDRLTSISPDIIASISCINFVPLFSFPNVSGSLLRALWRQGNSNQFSFPPYPSADWMAWIFFLRSHLPQRPLLLLYFFDHKNLNVFPRNLFSNVRFSPTLIFPKEHFLFSFPSTLICSSDLTEKGRKNTGKRNKSFSARALQSTRFFLFSFFLQVNSGSCRHLSKKNRPKEMISIGKGKKKGKCVSKSSFLCCEKNEDSKLPNKQLGISNFDIFSSFPSSFRN